MLFRSDGIEYQIGHTVNYVKVALQTEKQLTNSIEKVKIVGFLNKEVLKSISLH